MRIWHGLGFAVAMLSLACGGDGGGPSPSEFAGTWTATRFQYTNKANTAEKVDIIAQGATVVVVMDANGTYQMTLTPPGGAPGVTTGTWDASADILTIKETGMSGQMQFDYSLSGNSLTLSGADTDFDFGQDGTLEAARLSADLVRQ